MARDNLAARIQKRVEARTADFLRDKSRLDFAQTKFTVAKDLRRIFDIKWYVSRAFYKDEQYVFWNTTTGSLNRRPQEDVRRVRLVDNQIKPRVRKQQAKLLRLRPRAEVLPNTTERSDIDAAELGTDLLKHLHRTLKADKVARHVANWITTTGNAFVVDYWDKDKKEIALDVDSPFSWYLPVQSFGPTDIQEMPWAIRAKLRGIDWIKDTYGKDVTPESWTADQNILLMMRDADSTASGLEVTHIPSAIVKECWIKPTKKYPKGDYFVVANNVMLHKGTFPNYGSAEEPIYEYPVTHFRDITIPGLFWGQATMESAIPLQKDWNRVRSSVIEWVRSMAKGKWLAMKGQQLSPTALDNEHGEVVEFAFQRGFVPQQARIVPLPQAVFQALDANKQSMMDIFSQHEVTQAQNRSDLRSAAMVAMLLEQDDTAPAMTYHDFEDNWASMWKHVLMIAQKYYDTTRIIKVVGSGQDVKMTSFVGTDLKDNTDVFVATGTHLPENRLAKQAVIMERFTAGLYGNVQDPQVTSKVRRMLDDAIEEDIYDDMKADQDVAMDENRMFRNSTEKPINEYDNHAIHVAEHERDIKSPEVQAMLRRQGGDTIVQAYMTHIREHVKIMQQQMEKQLEMQARVQGGPQGGGGQQGPPTGALQGGQ
jgi:hypothetical protein